jgi:ABC-2 type transport system permease protein
MNTPSPSAKSSAALERFGWLLRREWMQHHRGWLILALIPAALALLLLPFGKIDIEVDEMPPTQLATAIIAQVYIAGVLLLAWAAVWFQAPGMARRDQQDRSIEFWLSLPTGHPQSLAATLLMHLLVMPLMVLVIAFACGQILALLAIGRILGLGAYGELDLMTWLVGGAAAFARLFLGVILCALWSAPLVLLAMAAAAWLKRWGVPALAAVLFIGGFLLERLTGSKVVWQTVGFWFQRAIEALMPLAWPDFKAAVVDQTNTTQAFSQWLWRDCARVLGELASPEMAAGLVLAAIGFGLLVLRRSGGVALPGVLARRMS